MSRFSRARLNREANHFDAKANRADKAALDGDRFAKDPTLDPYSQGVAARFATVARRKVREYRHLASVLRDGDIPDGLQLD